MLPASARMRRSQEFSLVLRRGRRAGRSRLVLHLLPPDSGGAHATGHAQRTSARAAAAPTRESGDPTRVGFVVSKAVGNAVVRHRVARQLRHLMRARLDRLTAGTLVVVRALPAAAAASSDELSTDVDSALRKLGGAASRERRDGPVPDETTGGRHGGGDPSFAGPV